MVRVARSEPRARRRALALAAVVALVAAVLALGRDERVDVPQARVASEVVVSAADVLPDAEPVAPSAARTSASTAPAVPSPPTSPPSAVEPGPRGNVVLRAFHETTLAWIPEFRWSLVHGVPGVVAQGTSAAGTATIAVPLRVACSFLVEAEGYFASLPVDGTLQDGLFREVHVALVPRPASGSVRVVARDDFGQPVTRLRAACRSRGVDREAKGAFAEVYELTSVADSGVHELPAPPEGWCRLALSPLQLANDARILQTQEVEFRHTATAASEHEVVFPVGARVVVVARGGLEDLRLLDGTARPLGTALVPGPLRGEEREWHAAKALGPGDYAVAYRLGGQSLSRAFRLAAGQELRLLLP